MSLYFIFILGIALSRLYEVRLSKHHFNLAQRTSPVHLVAEPIYPWMVLFHSFWLVACLAEVYFLKRPFVPVWGVVMTVIWGVAFSTRLWVLRTMQDAWNVRIIDHPEQTIVSAGPYRYIRHPNYAVVIVEIFCIPMIHNAYWTACLGSVLNGLLIWKRLQKEEAYLASLPAYEETMAQRPRFIPKEVSGWFQKFFKH